MNSFLPSILFFRSTSCSSDICSFNTLKEMERNHPPGLQIPYFHTGAPLAPRTGREQPYWYRPCYVGWQYFTSGKFDTAFSINIVGPKHRQSLKTRPHGDVGFPWIKFLKSAMPEARSVNISDGEPYG